MGKIRLGTSGYSFQSWKGNVYPATIKNADMFTYYLSRFGFNTVEINYTYYHLPSAATMASHVRKAPDDFDFTVKLFGGITHDPWKTTVLGKLDTGLCEQFIEGVKPLTESGKLGCVLAQFPSAMSRNPTAKKFVSTLAEALEGLPLVCEFRNRGWASKEIEQELRQAGIGYCAVDEPQIGVLMPLVPLVTSDIAYLRLHGRNRKWFQDSSQRYDYLYSNQELLELLPKIKAMASSSETMYVAFNNCHAGSAVVNAKMMLDLLDEESNQDW